MVNFMEKMTPSRMLLLAKHLRENTLQLQVIERGIELWTNEGDTVLSPFMGIGSEGYVALRTGRQFIGCELKRSYWEQACRNLEVAARSAQPTLFET